MTFGSLKVVAMRDTEPKMAQREARPAEIIDSRAGVLHREKLCGKEGPGCGI